MVMEIITPHTFSMNFHIVMNFFKRKIHTPQEQPASGPPGRAPARVRAGARGPYALRASKESQPAIVSIRRRCGTLAARFRCPTHARSGLEAFRNSFGNSDFSVPNHDFARFALSSPHTTAPRCEAPHADSSCSGGRGARCAHSWGLEETVDSRETCQDSS